MVYILFFLRFVKSMEMNMHPFDNHEVLLGALQKGEEKAFEYLFDKYYEGLLNYAGRIVREIELAHDLVQETFSKEGNLILAFSKSTLQRLNLVLPCA